MKGIATRMLVMLILGIISLAIVSYLLYRTFTGGTERTFSEEECKAKITSKCSDCMFCAGSAWTTGYCGNSLPCNISACVFPTECSTTISTFGLTSCDGGKYAGYNDCKKMGVK
jgi:hypothetical protein